MRAEILPKKQQLSYDHPPKLTGKIGVLFWGSQAISKH